MPQAPFEHKVSLSVEEGQGHLQPGNGDEDVEEDVHKAGWLLVVETNLEMVMKMLKRTFTRLAGF